MGERISGKKSRGAEKNWKGGPFGLARYGMLRGKTGKIFWFSSLDQIVQFGAIIFCRTFKNYFGQFVWIEKKKSHYNGTIFHFMKRRLKRTQFCCKNWWLSKHLNVSVATEPKSFPLLDTIVLMPKLFGKVIESREDYSPLDISPLNYYNVVSYVHIPLVPYMQERSDVRYGHASLLLLGEGSESTEPYNKYANLFK